MGSYARYWASGVPGYPPEHPLRAEGLIEFAARLGLKVVQIADNMPLDAISQERLSKIRDLSQERGIAIEVGTRGITLGHLRRCLKLARFFDSPILRVVVDTSDHHPSPSEVVQLISRVVPHLEDNRVVLAIENHDRFKCRQLVQILEQVNSPWVGICLDTVNSFGALEGPDVVVDTLAPWVVNLHLKDFTVRRAVHMMGFSVEGCPAGEGQLDIPWLLSTMRTHGKDPNAILELWVSPEERLEDTIRKEEQWAVRSVNHLRSFIPD